MLDLTRIRPHFPALTREHAGRPLVYFDAPGGTQVTQSCIDSMTAYLGWHNANTHGAFVTSAETDGIIEEAHTAMADFLNARSGDEIVFGQNMTSLTFAISRSIGQTLKPGDEIILTRLDHDANFSPWRLMADERGVTVRVIDVRTGDVTLNLDDFERYLSEKTKLVAVGCASNAVGTINPVKHIVGMAKAVGALTYLDAVHYAPHAPVDVQDLDCDFLACSAYKFFGPHIGALYGKYDLLDRLPAYKVRPANAKPPHKFETGTQSFESQSGVIGVMRYLEWLGKTFGEVPAGRPLRSERAAALHAAMRAIQDYERELSAAMIDGLLAVPGLTLYGIRDKSRLRQRTPTFAVRVRDEHPRDTAKRLGDAGICVWDGNYYALNLTERLDVESRGGMVRIGLAHYNTREEVDRLLDAIA